MLTYEGLSKATKDLIRHLKQLNAVSTGTRVLILDPLFSYIGDCQINAANEVRPRFNCPIRIAKETGCAIVIINHLSKMFGTKAIYRTLGSIDIVDAIRSALLNVDKRENEPS